MTDQIYSPQHIANYFLKVAKDENKSIRMLKLQKLVYIAYGWMIALTDRKLFEEDIQAWKHGPVIPSLYHEFKHFGSNPIETFATSFDVEDGGIVLCEPSIPDTDNDAQIVLEKVWQVYRDHSGWSLRNLTHEDGTPWALVYNCDERSISVSDESIKVHYKERIQAYLEASKVA